MPLDASESARDRPGHHTTEPDARRDTPRPGAMHSFSPTAVVSSSPSRLGIEGFVDVDDDGYANALASAALGRAEFERFITDVKQRAVVC